jgi:hypothetical protein
MRWVGDFSANSAKCHTLTISLKNAEVMCQRTPGQFLVQRKA